MSSFSVIQNTPNIDNLPYELALGLESLRADCLDKVLCHEAIEDIANFAVSRFETLFNVNKIAVFTLCPVSGNLRLTANPSIPSAFTNALQSSALLSADDHCGQAFYTGKTGEVSAFLSQPKHAEMRRVAEYVDIHSCASFPINGLSGDTLGALDIYTGKQAGKETHFSEDQWTGLCAVAHLLGRVVEQSLVYSRKERANVKMRERLDEQQNSLAETHYMLTKALAQRDEVRAQLVEMEKMASMGTMVSSMTHEMTSPLGVSLTAITHLLTLQQESMRLFDNQKLRRSQLAEFYQDCEEACKIAERNLIRASKVVDIFKQISVDQHSEQQRLINLSEFVSEILLSLKPELKRTRHMFCIGIDSDLQFFGLPGALGQILINMIINSVKHAYRPDQAGRICIFATLESSLSGQTLEIVYSDDGKGMDEYTRQNIYRPFFTLAKQSGGTGLGMHICYNLAVNMLNGSIKCDSELNRGTRFTLRVPVNRPQ